MHRELIRHTLLSAYLEKICVNAQMRDISISEIYDAYAHAHDDTCLTCLKNTLKAIHSTQHNGITCQVTKRIEILMRAHDIQAWIPQRFQ